MLKIRLLASTAAGVVCAYAVLGADEARAFSCDEPGARSQLPAAACGGAAAPAALASPYRVDDALTVAVRVGSTRVELDLGQYEPMHGIVATSTSPVRLFGSLELNGGWKFDSWALDRDAPPVRNAFPLSDPDGVSLTEERDNGRLGFGGRIGYLIEQLFEPYARAGVEYNYAREANVRDDRVGIVFGGGLNIFATEGFSANLEGTTTTLRSNLDLYSINARIRFEF